MISSFIILSSQLEGNLEEQTKDSLKETGKGEVLDSLQQNNSESSHSERIIKTVLFLLSLFIMIKGCIIVSKRIDKLFVKKLKEYETKCEEELQEKLRTEEASGKRGIIKINLSVIRLAINSVFNEDEEAANLTETNNEENLTETNNEENIKRFATGYRNIESKMNFVNFFKYFQSFWVFLFCTFLILFELKESFPYFNYVAKLFVCLLIAVIVIFLTSFMILIGIKYMKKTLRGNLVENLNEFSKSISENLIMRFLLLAMSIMVTSYIFGQENVEFINFNVTLKTQINILLQTILTITFCFVWTFLRYRLKTSKTDFEKEKKELFAVILITLIIRNSLS